MDCSRYHIISEIYSALIKSTVMEYEAEGPRPKRTWREVAEKDCQARKLNTEDARWRKKLIKDV